MGRKGLVTSIFSKLVDTSSPSSSPIGGGVQSSPPQWPWPSSCRSNPQTTSFRAGDDPCCTTAGPTAGDATTTTMSAAGRLNRLRGAAGGEMYKTVNSVYFDSAVDDYFSLDAAEEEEEEEEEEVVVDDDESCFSTTTASEEWSEAVIRSLGRSTSTHRFFFDPGPPSINSTQPAPSPQASTTTTPPPKQQPPDDPEPDLVDDGEKQQQPCSASKASSSLAEGSVAVAVDSSDPFGDFRASMEEMVAAHGLRDWPALEELLSWYLRVNGKQHHPLIVGAFVDMLVGLASSRPSTTTTTTATTTTTTTSSAGKSTKSSTTCTCSATSFAATKRGHRGANEASCSSSSSCAAPDEAEEKASDPSTSDDVDRIHRHECEQHHCRST